MSRLSSSAVSTEGKKKSRKPTKEWKTILGQLNAIAKPSSDDVAPIPPGPMHEDGKSVSFDQATNQFHGPWGRMSALLKPMARLFFPKWNYDAANSAGGSRRKKSRFIDLYASCTGSGAARRPPPRCEARRMRARRLRQDHKRLSGSSLSGVRRELKRPVTAGQRLDDDLSCVVHFVRKYGITVQQLLRCAGIPGCIRDPIDRGYFQYLRHHVGTFTRKVLQYLDDEKLQPMHAQLVVSDSKFIVATKADLVCRNADGRVIVFDTKAGFSGNYLRRSTDSPMSKPFERIGDCLFNQHQLQVALTRLMYCESTNPEDPKKVDGAVLYVRDDGVEQCPLASYVCARADKALVSLAADIQKKRPL